MSNYSSNNDFNTILSRLLANVDNTLDKRQGSVIYDALAPAAAELAQAYIALDIFADQTYLLTATGINLDNRVADYGITRNLATKAKKTLTITDINGAALSVPIGTRFSVPNAYGGYNFIITSTQSAGTYTAECETAGTVGNSYTGAVLPLQYINNLGTATLGTIVVSGDDSETDAELLDRALLIINQEAFAGNKAAYRTYVENLDGVEACKVFPVWNGGGTVKLGVMATDYTIPSSTLINTIQNLIDPVASQGQGIGIAPIGHTVTVVAPSALDVDIACTLTIETGYTIAQLQSDIESKIGKYLKTVQDKWAENNILKVYVSQVVAAILSVEHVLNVTNLTINSSSSDLTITLSGNNVVFPMLGEVTLNAN